MLKQLKKYKCIIIFIFIILCISILSKQNFKKEELNKEKNKYDFNLETKNILNRYTYCKDKNTIIIGKSKKEILNGYYDLKIEKQDKNINIYINKLFKEFKNNIICDKEYLKEIVIYINKLINFKFDFTKLELKIEKVYLEIKTSQEKEFNKESVVIENQKIEFNNFNNMLQIII